MRPSQLVDYGGGRLRGDLGTVGQLQARVDCFRSDASRLEAILMVAKAPNSVESSRPVQPRSTRFWMALSLRLVSAMFEPGAWARLPRPESGST